MRDQGEGRCDGTGVCDDETISYLQQKESSHKKHANKNCGDFQVNLCNLYFHCQSAHGSHRRITLTFHVSAHLHIIFPEKEYVYIYILSFTYATWQYISYTSHLAPMSTGHIAQHRQVAAQGPIRNSVRV